MTKTVYQSLPTPDSEVQQGCGSQYNRKPRAFGIMVTTYRTTPGVSLISGNLSRSEEVHCSVIHYVWQLFPRPFGIKSGSSERHWGFRSRQSDMHDENRAPIVMEPSAEVAARMRVSAGWRCGLFERTYPVMILFLSSSHHITALRDRFSLVFEVNIFKTDRNYD